MFRYSLKTLLLVMFGVSVLCALFAAVPMPVTASIFLLALVMSAPVVVAGCVYFRGGAQAFCLGCAVPTSVVFLSVALGDDRFARELVEEIILEPLFQWRSPDHFVIKAIYVIYAVIFGLSGLASLLVYRQSQRGTAIGQATLASGESAMIARPHAIADTSGHFDGQSRPPREDAPARNSVPAPLQKPNNP